MTLAKPSAREHDRSRANVRGGTVPFRPSFPVLDAKLSPPRPRPGIVARERLLNILDAPGPRVVSLVAPPGYGKTTVLAQWAERTKRPVVWLTLDGEDNDPNVLVSYLAMAFDRVKALAPATAAAMTGSGRRILSSVVPRLSSELAEWRVPGLLVIDDAHRLKDRTCLDAIAALLDHLPPGFRMAVAGRYQPELPFARLTAERQIVEIGPAELALDDRETSALIEAAGHVLSEHEVRILNERTEGWAAGTYLALLALRRGNGDVQSISAIRGGDHHMAAYLRAEYIDGLEAEDITFLTRSAILERVSPSLADAVTEIPGSALRLRRLAHHSLLIQEISAEGPTYRYHNLLRDFLLAELDARAPDAAGELHRRAAEYHHTNGRTDLAIEHALLAGDLDGAAVYVTSTAYATHQHGRTATLERWLTHFDQLAFERHPSLAIIAAWVHLLIGAGDRADAMADIAERVVYHGPPGDGSASFASQRAMLRAVMSRSGPRDALASARIAVSLERPGSPWRATALMAAGSAHEMLGDFDAADLAYEEAIGAGAATSWATVMTSLAKRAQLRMNAGDWQAAERYIERAEELRELWRFDGFVSVLFVHAISARISLQRGDSVRGRESLIHAQLLRPLANHAAPWLSVDALLNLSRAHLAVSDPAGAQLTLREAEQIVRRRPSLGTLTTQLVEVRAHLADATATLIGSSALTSAEMRVLPFLPTYLSFQEIAERLLISRNTVKTHAMSIYGKLWASSRGEAVERAVEMGLLEPYPALARSTPPTSVGSVRHLRLVRPDEVDDERDTAT